MAGQFQRVRVPSLSLLLSLLHSTRLLLFSLLPTSLCLILSFALYVSLSSLLFSRSFFSFFSFFLFVPPSLNVAPTTPCPFYVVTRLCDVLNTRISLFERGSSSRRFLIGHEYLVDLSLLTIKWGKRDCDSISVYFYIIDRTKVKTR